MHWLMFNFCYIILRSWEKPWRPLSNAWVSSCLRCPRSPMCPWYCRALAALLSWAPTVTLQPNWLSISVLSPLFPLPPCRRGWPCEIMTLNSASPMYHRHLNCFYFRVGNKLPVLICPWVLGGRASWLHGHLTGCWMGSWKLGVLLSKGNSFPTPHISNIFSTVKMSESWGHAEEVRGSVTPLWEEDIVWRRDPKVSSSDPTPFSLFALPGYYGMRRLLDLVVFKHLWMDHSQSSNSQGWFNWVGAAKKDFSRKRRLGWRDLL